jgi:CDP-diacylglycerol--serine O-phosphatidyltransferase
MLSGVAPFHGKLAMTHPAPSPDPRHAWRSAIPNAITLAGILCGLQSMVWATTRPYDACLAIIAAALFDMVDGRVARLVHGQSELGAQLDSLADLVSFGVAPAWLAHRWVLPDTPTPLLDPWLVTAFFFVACAALRLARFNAGQGAGTSWAFEGLPTPAAALLLICTVMAWHELQLEFLRQPAVIAPLLIAIGSLMVSRVPFRTYKSFRTGWGRRLFFGAIAGGLGLLLLRGPGGSVLLGLIATYVLLGLSMAAVAALRRPKRNAA